MTVTAPLVAKILEAAARTPEKDALIFSGERVSYGRLKEGMLAAAGKLESAGVRRGDRVVLSARNRRPDFVYGYLACHSLGAIAVPVDWAVPAPALAEIMRLTRAKLAWPEEGLGGAGTGGQEAAEIGLDEPADILFTGGTTGRPKGVVQTHRNILAFAGGRAAVVGASTDDRLVLPLPLSHGYGLCRLRATLLCGATAILVDGFLAPGDVLRAFDESGGTSLCCVPSGFEALLQLASGELAGCRSRIRYIESATAPLHAATAARLLSLLPETRLFNAYGMTETTSSIAYVDLLSAPGKAGSVGKAVPGIEIRIGRDGRVLVRGASVMSGYWENSEETKKALDGDWYAANDLGALDAEGYLFLKGRPEEMINVGGLKVAPAELENLLREHPAVADCACVGVADPAGFAGERVKAILVPAPGGPRPSQREIVDWLRGKVEAYKVPAQVVWLDALPKTELGKVDRSALR